jgi:signal transduction histidine kinase
MTMGVYNTAENDIRWITLDAMPRWRPGEKKKPYQAYTIFNDITEAKVIEHETIRAKQKAEEADQLKSAFLACMSHEIRTPLNGIIGSLDLILSTDLQIQHRQENLECLQTAMNSANLLISIIQDVLDLSKIEAGQLDIVQHPISIRAVLEDSLRLANSLRMQKKKEDVKLISVIDDSNSFNDRIYGDQYRIQQGKNGW